VKRAPMKAPVPLLLAVLTLVAGYIDAVAFFGLGVFTANMTGNTVLLAGGIAGRFIGPLPGGMGIALPLISLACFAAGGYAAAAILRRESGRPPVRTIAVMAAVVLLIALAAAFQHWAGARFAPAVVGLLSAVLGAQSIVAIRAGVEGVSTTFVTGTLVRAIVDLAGTPVTTPAIRSEGRTNAAVLAFYLAGGIFGAFALRGLGSNALWVPAAVVALLLAVI
jgi:uncharacterized membrane protein YoaK (UPF0700 family)